MRETHLSEFWFYFVKVLHTNMSKDTTAITDVRYYTLPLHREPLSDLTAPACMYKQAGSQIRSLSRHSCCQYKSRLHEKKKEWLA